MSTLQNDTPYVFLNRKYATGPAGQFVEYIEIPSQLMTVTSPLVEDMIQRLKSDASSKGLEFRTIHILGPLDPVRNTRMIAYTAEFSPLRKFRRADGPFVDDYS